MIPCLHSAGGHYKVLNLFLFIQIQSRKTISLEPLKIFMHYKVIAGYVKY